MTRRRSKSVQQTEQRFRGAAAIDARRPVAVTFLDQAPLRRRALCGDGTFRLQLLAVGGGRARLLHRAQRSLQLRRWQLHAQHSAVAGTGKRDGTNFAK